MNKDLLLEIGTEELPARFVTPALEQLRQITEERLSQARLKAQKISVFGTPRRLAILAESLPEKSPDHEEILLGPLASAAKDAQGQWTPAAIGFAKSLGLSPEGLKILPSPKGERLGLEKIKRGELTSALLTKMLPEIISALRFPKTMVWEESLFAFARPIRWITALWGARPIRFKLAGVTSGSASYGLLEISAKKINIPSPKKYESALKNHCVIADVNERSKLLHQLLEGAAKRLKTQILVPPELFEEVVNLVEHPVAVIGSFDARYLALPFQVLRASMQKHQKFFPVLSAKGHSKELLVKGVEETSGFVNHFVAIRNGVSENQDVVRDGYERVLSARLADAEFFYQQDRKKKLEAFAEGLGGIGFHQKLGSMMDKVKRVEKIAGEIAGHLIQEKLISVDIETHVRRAAKLCKADLLTHVVYEFPELQGIMGRLYAEKDNEPQGVSDAMEQHYWPLTTESEIPRGPVGAVLALADKLDTLCADFSVGIMPTGSADPHGLRKAGTGILRILLEKHWSLSLAQLVERACATLSTSREGLAKQVLDFLKGRLENWLLSRQYRQDEIAAVVAVGFFDLPDFMARLDCLKTLRSGVEFGLLWVAFKRTGNILEQAKQKGFWKNNISVDPQALSEPSEKNLHKVFLDTRNLIQPCFDRKDYKAALDYMKMLKTPIDIFFEKTMVMAEDPALRSNRLALLHEIAQLFFRVGDFKQLQDAPPPQVPANAR